MHGSPRTSRLASARLAFGTLAVSTVLVAAPRDARADTEACAQAYESAQALRVDSKPIEARKQLLVCAQDSCPAVLRKDCVGWLTDVANEIPAVAIRVHGPDGCDRPEAHITIDGAATARAAEGKPIEVDPGSHTIQATLGDAKAEQVVVVTTADRRRLVTIEFASAGAVCGTPSPAVDASGKPPSDSRSSRPPPMLTYVLGGVGVVTGAVAIGFGISAWSQKGTLDDCKGSCAQRDVDTMRRTFLVADITMLVSIASLATAAAFYFTR